MTVRFKSKQTYAVYDKQGRLLAGDPGEVLNVEDIWVFEHGMKLPNARWRLAARMSLPAPGEADLAGDETNAPADAARGATGGAGAGAGGGGGGGAGRAGGTIPAGGKTKKKSR